MAEPQVSIWIRARETASKVFSTVEKNLRGMARLGTSVARDLGAITVATGAVITGLTKLSQRGADVLGVQKAFNRVVGGDGPAALEQLRQATGGVVSDFELMTKFNLSVARGMVRSVEEFGALSKAATTLSDVIGVDDAQAFDQLADAMGKGNLKGLANLGIMIDAKLAYDEYAKALGKGASALTGLEQKEAIRRAGMKEAERLAKNLSGGELEAADNANRFAAQVANLKDQIALLAATSPSVQKFFGVLRDGVKMLGGADLERDAIAASVGKMTDPRALEARFHEVDARRAALERKLQGTPSTVSVLTDDGRTIYGVTDAWKELREELDLVEAEAAIVGKRLTEVASGPHAVGNGGGGATGGGAGHTAVGPFVATTESLQALSDRIAQTKTALQEAKMDVVFAGTADEAEKAQKKVDELTGSLTGMLAVADKLGGGKGLGVANLSLLLNPRRFSPEDQLGPGMVRTPSGVIVKGSDHMTGDFFLDQGKEVTGPSGIRSPAHLGMSQEGGAALLRAAAAREKEEDAAQKLADAGPLVVSSLGAMAQAAIEGSELTAQSVIGMFSNILQSLPGVGQLGGALIGAAAGIIGGLFGRHSEPTKVKIDSLSSQAKRDFADAQNERPLHVTVINEQGGQAAGKLEYELRRRERRDAVPRYV